MRLTVWEAVCTGEQIYIPPGSVAGVTRSADVVSVGIPLPDDANNGVTDVNQLGLSWATAGQFRVFGRSPSGRIKWVLVDTQAKITAGQSNRSGNFGGPDLAVDNGTTVTVATGAATFTIRKANFDVIDQAGVGTTTVVASGTSQGLVVMGPAPGQITCPPCTTVYSCANDGASAAIIEEKGPVKAVRPAATT